MSAPKESAPKRTEAPRPTCNKCGKVFNEDRQESLDVPDYEEDDETEGIICRNQPACRARILHKHYKDRGLKRWSRHTQEQLLPIMDIPPENYDKKTWKSVHTIEDRVLAAVEFYSTCFPVCLLFATQTDSEGEPIKEFGAWKFHTTRSIAAILGVHHVTFARAFDYWDERKVLRREDGRMYYDPEPKALTPKERAACTRNSEPILKELHALLPSAFNILKELYGNLPAEEFAPLRKIALVACTEQNAAFSVARTRAAKTVLAACHAHVTLCPRATLREQDLARACVLSTPGNGTHAQNRPVDEDGGIPVKELYTPLAADSLDEEDRQLLAEADPADRPELEAYLLEDTAESHRQDVEDAENQRRFLAQTARMRAKGELPRIPPPVTGPTPASVLYQAIPRWQKEYPNSSFALKQPFSALGKADRQFTQSVLKRLDLAALADPTDETLGFVANVNYRFANGQSPYDPSGPKTLGLLLEWAGDFARGRPARLEQVAHAEQQEAIAREREADLRAELAADDALNAQVEDCWEQMPIAEKMKRLKATRAELKREPRWQNMGETMRTSEVERCAKRTLKSEIQNAPEIAEGAGGPS